VTSVVSRSTADAAAALGPSWWAPGLTLVERRELADAPPGAGEPGTAAKGERRLARWRNEHRLAESGQFERRLADVELDEDGLLALLTEPPDALAARAAKPRWAGDVERVVGGLDPQRALPEPPADDGLAHAGFVTVVSPFTLAAVERLDAALDHELVDVDALRRGFIVQLNRKLTALASRTLILELNVLRVTGRLTGATPAERFWSFVHHFGRPDGLAALLDEYPVLARMLAQAADQTLRAWLELLDRLAADLGSITGTVFGGADPGRLVEAAFGSGDQHCGGRSVALLRFAGGGRLVYKPRPLAVHDHFNRVLRWFDAALPGLGLRVLTVLDRGEYGWVEFVEHRPCATDADVSAYYRRQGALLALLHTVAASDFHHENLIACADQPVLVDLETLFHPTLPMAGNVVAPDGDPAAAALERSALRVGLLPAVVWGEDGSAMDLSGLGGDRGQRMPFKVTNWSGAGTDEMRVVRVQPEFLGSQNRPKIGGADGDADVEVDPGRHTGDLLDGFRRGYRAVAQRRAEFAELLQSFADDQVRVVARPTQIYGTLLQESTHPDVLRDALDRDKIFDHLWALSAGDPVRERLIRHELADLWAGDVPLFTTRPGSTDVWTSRGVRLPGLLDTSGIAKVTGQLDRLGEDDLRVQEWIIVASMATRPERPRRADSPPADAPPLALAAPSPDAAGPPDPERLLAAARAVADRLAELAYRNERRANWLGLELVKESRWRVQPLRLDVYNGFPGVALFLGQLAGLTGEQRYAELARLALGEVPRLVDEIAELPADARATLSGCGAFGGLAGLAYVLAQLAGQLDEPALPGWLEQFVALAGETVEHDETLDVIGGSAGCIAVMLAMPHVAGALDVARACADRLVERAEPQEHGVAWRTSMDAVEPLTGFSHGAAGIGWALLRFAAATGDARCAATGREAFGYERHQYCSRLANWPDHRVLDGPRDADSSLHAWCHGSAGIGLARASVLAHPPALSNGLSGPDVEIAADLDLAVRSMLAAGPSGNHSLCHGELGNLELLTLAGRADLADVRSRRAAAVLDALERTGPRCGTPAAIPTPGLLAGLAGIGHGLLRLGFADRVPSALLLEPPPEAP
jgi:type 2 lantibiotic biosynthesis protein LanM